MNTFVSSTETRKESLRYYYVLSLHPSTFLVLMILVSQFVLFKNSIASADNLCFSFLPDFAVYDNYTSKGRRHSCSLITPAPFILLILS